MSCKVLGVKKGRKEGMPVKASITMQVPRTLGMHGPSTHFCGKACAVLSDPHSIQGCWIPYTADHRSLLPNQCGTGYIRTQWLTRASLFTKCLFSARQWTGGVSESGSLLVVCSKINRQELTGAKFPSIWNLLWWHGKVLRADARMDPSCVRSG